MAHDPVLWRWQDQTLVAPVAGAAVDRQQDGYRFMGEGTITTPLTGLVPGFSEAVASLSSSAPLTAR